ncbi:transcription factor 24-like [Megalops cyprinoides]|uniref:transcription factor 24-like n=1 Tax=Megalops cyprinoides TaxID=118141 RepID=UPI0018656B65|nr:transcription factor 24-like [Megalops cyprinoides]
MAESLRLGATSMDESAMERESRPSATGLQLTSKQPACRDPKKWVRSGLGGQVRLMRSQHSPENAARERSRVRNLRQAFHSLQAALPSVPPDTKLSKLDVLVLATNYIAHLTQTLDQGDAPADRAPPHRGEGYLHPVKKWPMRSLLYCGSVGELLSGVPAKHALTGEEDSHPLTPDPEGHTDWTSQK